MANKTWRAFERRVARFFGTERNALSGGNLKLTRSVSLQPKLFIECKQRKRFAAVRLWDDTKRQANRENTGRLPFGEGPSRLLNPGPSGCPPCDSRRSYQEHRERRSLYCRNLLLVL